MATPKTFCAFVIDAPFVKIHGNSLQFSKIYLPNVEPFSRQAEGVYKRLFKTSDLQNKFLNIASASNSSDREKREDFQGAY